MPANRWRAIADDLRQRIERGEWAAGDVLPTQRELMRQYDTTANGTVARALSALTAEGVLVADPSAPRRGTRVRSRHRVQRDLIAGLRMEYEQAVAGDHGGGTGLFEQMTGTSPGDVEVAIRYESAGAPPAVAAVLGVPESTTVLMRTFRYSIERTPHQLVMSYMSADVARAAGLTDDSCERPGVGTIAQLREAGVDVGRVTITLEARIPTLEETTELAVPPGVPVFAHERVMYVAERPVEMSRAVVAGDRVAYFFDVDLANGGLP